MSGALVASRKQMDAVGFMLIACVTGFGGGTLLASLLCMGGAAEAAREARRAPRPVPAE
jgi:uncharacterized membrane protein YeiH